MKVLGVPDEDLAHHLRKNTEWLEKIAEASNGRETVVSLVDHLLHGRMRLWAIEDGEIIAYGISEDLTYGSGDRWLRMYSGDPPDVETGIEIIKLSRDLAKELEYDGFESMMRVGWSRPMRREIPEMKATHILHEVRFNA